MTVTRSSQQRGSCPFARSYSVSPIRKSVLPQQTHCSPPDRFPQRGKSTFGKSAPKKCECRMRQMRDLHAAHADHAGCGVFSSGMFRRWAPVAVMMLKKEPLSRDETPRRYRSIFACTVGRSPAMVTGNSPNGWSAHGSAANGRGPRSEGRSLRVAAVHTSGYPTPCVVRRLAGRPLVCFRHILSSGLYALPAGPFRRWRSGAWVLSVSHSGSHPDRPLG